MDTSMDGAPSPAKGGADSGHTTSKTWRSGWWDFYPILERPRRPIVWSQSSVIFTAHPSQPLITGRHFSSSKQFILPSPNPVISLPGAYSPPTVISTVAPERGDQLLFAYYPRNDAEGLGCLWKRGDQLDNWEVKEYWPFARAGGAVAASWLSRPREWAATPAGNPTRLPSRGPSTPATEATLVVVTEDNNVIIYFYRYGSSPLQSIRRSLLNSGATIEIRAQNHTVDAVDTPTPVKYCIDAGISVGYNESSIFIASHSFRKPAPSLPVALPQATPFNSMDLSVPINLGEPASQEKKHVDFDTWGEDYTVSVHELQLRYDGHLINIFLHHFGTLDIGKASLARINFICAPPGSHSGDQPGSPRKPEKGSTYLALTAVNFHSYKAPPTSQLSLFSLVQKTNTPAGRAPIALWTVNPEATRNFDTGVIVHAESFVDLSTPSNALIQTFVLDHSGPLPQGRSNGKQVPVGTLRVLNLPDLSDNFKYRPSTVNYPSESAGRELPLFTALSPNRGLISTLSTSLWKSQVTVHTLPRSDTSDQAVPHPMASALAIAILGSRSTQDVIHCISAPKIPLAEARLVMYQALHILENYRNALPNAGTRDILGVATEVYCSRSKQAKDVSDREGLEDRWRTAYDICSVAACNTAFEHCRENDGYDLDVAWQIICLCGWIVNFAESLMKVAVLSSNTNPGQIEHLPESSPLCSPPLLHLAHPFALQNFVVALKHVKAIRAYLGSLPAGGENPKMAQLIITDNVDSCGIDFGGLITVLEAALPAVKDMNPGECRKALTDCSPVPQMQSHLFQLVKKISDSETILNKTKLFIKPSDLVDDVARLALESRKPDEKDIISKGILAKEAMRYECLRCGGKTSASKLFAKLPASVGIWTIWERDWRVRCICGGPWLRGLTPS